jgi:cell division septal protein FtsQ
MREGLWDRRLGGRGEQRSPLTRFGTAASPRITRPQSPIAERGRTGPLPERRGPYSVLLVLAASFAAGLGGGSSVAEATASWLAGEAPRLEAIAVRGAGQLSSAEIAAATGVPRGVDLRLVDAPAVAERLSRHPWIASARAVELPAGRLLVEVVERRAVATVSALDSEPSFVVDANGTAFAPASEAVTRELPHLVQSGPVAIGDGDPALGEAVELAARLAALGLPRPLEIGVAAPDDPTGFTLRLEGFAPRVVLGRDDLDARLDALARLLETGPASVAEAATLDLRFADQVVLRGTPSGNPAAVATGPSAAPSGTEASGGRLGSKPGGERP